MAVINVSAGNHNLTLPPDYIYINTNQLNVVCDCSAGPINLYLPNIKTVSLILGFNILITDEKGLCNVNNITVYAQGGSKINLDSWFVLNNSFQKCQIKLASETSWLLLNSISTGNSTKGDTGVKGDTGTTGNNGAKGDTGTAGNTGLKGDTGAGVQGDTGITGTSGLKGDTGTIGSSGVKGDTGAGIQGDTGVTGTSGLKGDTGTSGNAGAKGDTGTIGSSGAKGDTGEGIKGDTGVTGTIGLKGDTGTSGNAGAKGDTGTSGNTGAKGDTGSIGNSGAKGDTGTQGDTGAGTSGVKGDTGTSGNTGLKGDTGTPGDTGIGTTGAKGDTGTSGNKGDTGASGGTAAGSDTDVQYNNSTAFAGATYVKIEGGNLKLVSTTDPSAPSSGLILYSKSVAGRHLSKIIGPSGVDTIMQVGLHGNAVFMVAIASGTTAPTAWGGTLTTAATMSLQFTAGSTNVWSATARKRFQTSTTAGNATGMRTAYTQYFRGNAIGYGGFWFRAQLGAQINLNGGQKFVGLCASTGALAGEPSALVNMCGMGYDAADSSAGNWFFMRNDGSGTATKVDLGANAARGTTQGWDLIMFMAPNGSDLYVRIVNLNTGVTVLDTSYNTDLPAVNTGMAFKAEVRNGAVAAADNLEVAKVYIESDF